MTAIDCGIAAPTRPRSRFGLPMRLRRLRGSMYSLTEMARRKSPTKRMTTPITGAAIHHQMPATIAEWALAQ